MSVTRKHSLYAVGVGATLVGGITRQSIVTGSEVRSEASSGEIYARFQSFYAQKIAPSFTTRMISTALGASGALGASIAGLSGGLCLYAQAHADGGTRAGASAHRKYSFTKGILCPKTLTVDHRGDATLTYEAVVVYDGVNDPVVITDSVSLPAGITDSERFTIGPCTLGGILLGEIRQFQIDFGVDVIAEAADSDIWDTFCSVRQQNTVISLRGIDMKWFDSTYVPLAGLAGTHSNTICYLRKRAQGGGFVANGSAVHIKFTGAGTVYIENATDANGEDAQETSIKMPLYYDGSNAPLGITLGTAIV